MFAYRTARLAMAAQFAESLSPATLSHAIALDPLNPEPYHRLGLIYLYSLEELNPAEGVRYLRRATEINANKATYWSDFATACGSTGDTACVDQALERALNLSPMTPRLRWATANHYLLTNRPQVALAHFRRLLELSPDSAWPAFRLSLRAVGDPQVVFEEVVPPASGPLLKLAYVNFLSAQGETDFAQQVWAKTVASGSPFSFPLARPYLERLLGQGRAQQAAGVWRDLERIGAVQKPAGEHLANLVFNGSFEQPPLNAGFDWRARELPCVSVDFADRTSVQGARSLRIDFTVKRNEDYLPVYQLVPVGPNQTYELTAQVRSAEITSDSGPRLRVHDPGCPACLDVASAMTVGTTSWHPLSLTFVTGAQTQLVQLSMWRPRSRSFPTEIGGSFWVDAVSLRPLSPVAGLGLAPPAP